MDAYTLHSPIALPTLTRASRASRKTKNSRRSLAEKTDANFAELTKLAAEPGAKKISARDLAYISAPVVLHPGCETGHLVSNVIPQARLALLKSGERELATEEESLAYLSSASLCFPLNSDHAEIMFYLTDRVMARWYAQTEVWKQIGLESPPELSDYQQGLLRDLRGKIRRSAEKHGAKAKDKCQINS